MRTLIVPCAGQKPINGIPAYLNIHPDGQILVKKSLDGIPLGDFDRIIITILEYDNINYNAELLIKNAFLNSKSIEVIRLHEPTKDALETVFLSILYGDVKGKFVIKDTNNSIEISNLPEGNFIAGLDLQKLEFDIHNIRNKSFVILNEQRHVLDIIEKSIKSDYICVGLYGFNSVDEFIFAYKRLNDSNFPIRKLYISHVVSYLIGYQETVFHFSPALKFEDWSNEFLWLELQNRYTTYIINIDDLIESSVNSPDFSRIKESLARKVKEGAIFIGYTVNNENENHKINKFLSDNDITTRSLLNNFSSSEIVKVLSDFYGFKKEFNIK